MAFYYPRLEEKEDCIYRLPPPGNTQTQADLHHFWGDSPRMATASSLRILQWNANLMNLAKGSELAEFCAANKVDVICVSELGSYAPNLRNFTLAAFSCKGRGVGIYLRCHPFQFTWRRRQDILHVSDAHAPDCLGVAIDIQTSSTRTGAPEWISIFSVYLRPQATVRQRKSFTQNCFNKQDATIPFIWCGDLNDHAQIYRESHRNPTTPLQDLYDSSNLICCNDGSVTRPNSNNALDVTYIEGRLELLSWQVVQDLGSDHFPVLTELAIELPHSAPRPKSTICYIRDWTQFQSSVTTFIRNAGHPHEPAKAVDSLITTISGSMASTIRKSRHTYKGFWTRRLTILKNRRNRARNSGDRELYKRRNKEFLDEFYKLKRKHESDRLSVIASSSNPWCVLKDNQPELDKKFHGRKQRLPHEEAQEKAEEIAITFSNRFNDPSLSEPDHELAVDALLHRLNSSSLHYRKISRRELMFGIMTARSKSAPGEDKIRATVWKRLAAIPEVQEYLLQLHNALLAKGIWPSCLKHAIIVPVPKPGGGYRPISLLTTFGKIMERIVTKRLRELDIIRPNQFGCTAGLSAQHALLRLLHASAMAHVEQQHFGCVLLDFSKAYDRVQHDTLLLKIDRLGVPGYLLRFIAAWLEGRTFEVNFCSTRSNVYTARQGLPQGSPLSVICFLCYVQDLDVDNETSNLYVDDTACWQSAPSLKELQIGLQAQLDRISHWCALNHVVINPLKTQFIMNSMDPTVQLQLVGSTITAASSAKYLGVDLKSYEFGDLIQFDLKRVTASMRRRNALLKCLRWKLPTKQLHIFTTGLVVSQLSHLLPLLAMEHADTVRCLQVALNESLRVISGALKSTPIPLLYSETNMPTLKMMISEATNRLAIRLHGSPGILTSELARWNGTGAGFTPFSALKDAEDYLVQKGFRSIEMLSYFPAAGLDLIYDRVRLNCLETRTDAIRSLQQGTLLKSADISLWTDGAWNQTRGGAGAVLLDNTTLTPIRIYRQTIHNCHSSYQAEAHAFAGGLQMLHRFLQAHPATNSVSIYTDSRSLVTAIQAALIKAKPIGAGLFNSLSGLWEVAKLPDIAISLTWVPGHTGILGNEMADSLASRALVEPYSPRILPTPLSTLRLVFRKKRNGELRYYLRSSVQKSSNL